MSDDSTQTPQRQDGESQTLDTGTGAAQPSPETSPEGSPPEQDYKTKFSESTRENQRLLQENQQYAQQLQMLNFQMSQLQQQQQNPQFSQPNPQTSQEQFSDGSWLSEAEQKQLKEAYDNFDVDAQMRLNQLQIRRANEQNQQAILNTLAGAATQAQGVQGVIGDLQRAPELQDKAVANQVLTRAMQIQNDPFMSQRIPQGQWPIGGGVTVNPYAVERALLEVRSAAPMQKAQNQASQSAYADLGGDAPATAQPGTSTTFNPQVHLTESEREAIRIAAVQRPQMYGSKPETAYKNFWKKLTEDDRKRRLKGGAEGRTASKERMVIRPREKPTEGGE
jgi:hypothetical protein